MDCPTCSTAMSFVPANQNWWCNTCLAATEGEAPAGLKGPTADQVAEERHEGSHAEVASKGEVGAASGWAVAELVYALPVLLLLGGVLLILSGSGFIGAILIGAVILGWIVMS